MSKNVDQRGKLEETPFSYRISKDGTVFLEYRSRVVKTLRDRAAQASSSGLKPSSRLTCNWCLQS